VNGLGFVCGLTFGFVIVAARLSDDNVIRDMLLLRDPQPYLVIGSAVLVAAPLLHLLRACRWRAPLGGETVAFRGEAIRRHHLAGAALFGIGWAISCTCPVPALGMLATGNLLGLPVVAGLLTGIVLRDTLVAAKGARRVFRPVPAG
jgi:uncharacterized membrane protein YedE/YeeE